MRVTQRAGPRPVSWAACLWPGLPPLWYRGSWLGLACACAFGALLNAALWATYVWTELVSAQVAIVWWTLLGVAWIAAVMAHLRGRKTTSNDASTEGDLFPRALSEYLQGSWFQAEATCQRLLSHDAWDVPTHLLLATLLRRTGRLAEARRRLDELQSLDNSAGWEWEITREYERIREAASDEHQAPPEAEHEQQNFVAVAEDAAADDPPETTTLKLHVGGERKLPPKDELLGAA